MRAQSDRIEFNLFPRVGASLGVETGFFSTHLFLLNNASKSIFSFQTEKGRKVEKKESPESSINLTSSDEEGRLESRTPSKSPTPRRKVENEETSEARYRFPLIFAGLLS